MQLRYEHGTPQQAAIERLKNLRPHLISKFGSDVSDLQERWTGNVLAMSFSARGQKTTGTMTVEDGSLVLDAKLPLAARLIEGRIKHAIEDALDSVFA